MADRSSASTEHGYAFGPFRLMPHRKLLFEDERPIRLGSRAFDILTVLVGRAGEVVEKGELISRVWPSTTVDDINLRVNLMAVRKALGDGRPGRRYVVNLHGRGYQFVAPVEPLASLTPAELPKLETEAAHNLPALLTRPVGRADIADALARELSEHPLITLVGSGGIGKTTLALTVAEIVLADFRHGIRFVDLAPLHDAQHVPGAVAAAVGLAIHAQNVVPGVIAHLRDRNMLIMLDSCERWISAASVLAEALIAHCPDLRIVATSREPLRAQGERVRRIPPLAGPPVSTRLAAQGALSFPAVQLFVERAAASRDGFELTNADAPVVADICRKLDGIALAIELAAAHTDAFSLRDLSAALQGRLDLLHGRRTGPARHRTLAAALDWSYELLSEHERSILRRLSVFAGAFTLEAACCVAASDRILQADVIEAVLTLVEKSLVTADVTGDTAEYRLLDTTRAYAFQKLSDKSEHETVARRHAEYHRDLFRRAEAEWEARPTADWAADYASRIDDLRHALEWAFSPGGDASIGVALTVAAVPLWSHLSLMEECRVRVQAALARYRDRGPPSAHDEMKLYSALGAASLHGNGPLVETDRVWARALEAAEILNGSQYQLRALWGLAAQRIAVGQYRAGLAFAERFRALARERNDVPAWLMGARMTGAALHYLGHQRDAMRDLQLSMSSYVSPVERSHFTRFHFDQRALAKQTLSSVLWIQGFPDQARLMAEAAVQDARASGHALTLCIVLFTTACTISLYVGDLAATERFLEMLKAELAAHTFPIWSALGRCMRGILLIERHEAAGLSSLYSALDELRRIGFLTRYPAYLGRLAAGLGVHGFGAEALATIADALEWAQSHEERWCIPELLRIKGDLVLADASPAAIAAAETCYMQAIQEAQQQGALSWELRAGMSLNRLWQGLGKREEARDMLRSIYGRFGEGFETGDLRAAYALMQ